LYRSGSTVGSSGQAKEAGLSSRRLARPKLFRDYKKRPNAITRAFALMFYDLPFPDQLFEALGTRAISLWARSKMNAEVDLARGGPEALRTLVALLWRCHGYEAGLVGRYLVTVLSALAVRSDGEARRGRRVAPRCQDAADIKRSRLLIRPCHECASFASRASPILRNFYSSLRMYTGKRCRGRGSIQ
jgi:hypothetical protein